MIWKLIIFFGVIGLVIVGSILLLGGIREDDLLYTITPDFLKAKKLPVFDSFNTSTMDGLNYFVDDNGRMVIRRGQNVLSRQGFVIQGTVEGVNVTRTTEEFTWTWTKDIEQQLIIEIDERNITYESIVEYPIFRGYNNQPNFNWTQEWIFYDGTTKIKHTITNNLGRDITNVKFWYVHFPQKNDTIIYNRENHLINFNGDYEFQFGDLIDNGFVIDEVKRSRGSLGYGDYTIAIGVTKGSGTLRDGQTIILDPLDTGYISPTDEGYPSDQWALGQHILTSNDIRTTETTIGHLQDTSNYNFNLPDNAVIEGIEIQIEGKITAILPP